MNDEASLRQLLQSDPFQTAMAASSMPSPPRDARHRPAIVTHGSPGVASTSDTPNGRKRRWNNGIDEMLEDGVGDTAAELMRGKRLRKIPQSAYREESSDPGEENERPSTHASKTKRTGKKKTDSVKTEKNREDDDNGVDSNMFTLKDLETGHGVPTSRLVSAAQLGMHAPLARRQELVDTLQLAGLMKAYSSRVGVGSVSSSAVDFVAQALRQRLEQILERSIDAALHRVNTHNILEALNPDKMDANSADDTTGGGSSLRVEIHRDPRSHLLAMARSEFESEKAFHTRITKRMNDKKSDTRDGSSALPPQQPQTSLQEGEGDASAKKNAGGKKKKSQEKTPKAPPVPKQPKMSSKQQAMAVPIKEQQQRANETAQRAAGVKQRTWMRGKGEAMGLGTWVSKPYQVERKVLRRDVMQALREEWEDRTVDEGRPMMERGLLRGWAGMRNPANM